MADKLISADKLSQNFQRKTWYSSDEVLDTISDAQGVEAESMYAVYECWSNCEEYEDSCYSCDIIMVATSYEKAKRAVEERKSNLIKEKDGWIFEGRVCLNPEKEFIDMLSIKDGRGYWPNNDYGWEIKEIEFDTFLL